MDIHWPVLIGCFVLAAVTVFLNGGSSGSRSSRRTGRGRRRGFSGAEGRFSSRRSFSGGGGRFSSRRSSSGASKSSAKRRRR